MAVRPEGTPCWVDAMFGDVEGAKRFYGDVLGWTFGEASSEYGNYTHAYADGSAVAAVVPPMPGQEGQSQWCLYFAAADAAATAATIREHGGAVLMEPMRVGEFGCFEAPPPQPGAYCWAEVFTREPEKSDAFFTSVFGYRARQLRDDAIDFRMFDLGGETVLGRMRMTGDFPPEVPPYINVYFTVGDCDDAVAKATKLGGVLRFGPMDSPFGRFAALSDPQGANFSVIDVTTRAGEMPQTTDVS
ncbi:VOC family protein [Streptomyces sp. 7R007]